MTKHECAIIMAYTGVCMLRGEDFSIFHKYVEKIMHKTIYMHELVKFEKEIKEKSEPDFMKLCEEAKDSDEKIWLHITF